MKVNVHCRQLILVVALVLLTLLTSNSRAQCANAAQPSCSVYSTCFSQACQCSTSTSEYFISYGKKYCQTFLELDGLSDKGKSWRDSTLRCLQERIVPELPPDGQASSCNCAAMQIKAFDLHVACYTQASNSICALSLDDWKLIFSAAGGVQSLADQKSRKQIVEVAKICVPVVADDLKQMLKDFIANF